jgi:UrcA family protein
MHGRMTAPVVAALISGLATIAIAAPAFGQEPPVMVYGESAGVKTERVAFADLDLASASQQARLNHRVSGAIERVCDIDLGRDGLQDRGFYACANAAWSAAAPQIAEAISTGKTSIAGAAIVISGR